MARIEAPAGKIAGGRLKQPIAMIESPTPLTTFG